MSFRLSVHQFFVGQKEITTNHFAPKIQLFTKANFSEKDVWEFRPHRTRGAPWALKDRLHRLWKNGHPRWWYWWRFGISREWTCTDVRKVPSDCDVDDDDVDDDPIGPVKEKSRDIADFNIFDRDQEYNPFRIWKIQVQKKKNWVKKWMEKSAMRGGEAPKGYCHENLWILELGGGGRFFIYLVSVEVLSRNMVKTSTCRSFIQTLVKTSTCRSFIQNWVKTST